jgi:hypothetical protein
MNNLPDSSPRWSAFFDVDGTLISIKSMFSFLDYLEVHLPASSTSQLATYRQRLQQMMAQEQPREAINRFDYSLYAGCKWLGCNSWGVTGTPKCASSRTYFCRRCWLKSADTSNKAPAS